MTNKVFNNEYVKALEKENELLRTRNAELTERLLKLSDKAEMLCELIKEIIGTFNDNRYNKEAQFADTEKVIADIHLELEEER